MTSVATEPVAGRALWRTQSTAALAANETNQLFAALDPDSGDFFFFLTAEALTVEETSLDLPKNPVKQPETWDAGTSMLPPGTSMLQPDEDRLLQFFGRIF